MGSAVTPQLSGPVPPDETWRLEQFSFAYVRAVAAAAGVSVDVTEVDDDSVDLTLKRRTSGTPRKSPRLDVQVKATTGDCLRSDHIAFPISIKNYDELRDSHLSVPRILIVVLVPAELEEWTEHSEERLALARCAYWTSLRGSPEVENTHSRTVHLSRSNALNARALDAIFVRLANGGEP